MISDILSVVALCYSSSDCLSVCHILCRFFLCRLIQAGLMLVNPSVMNSASLNFGTANY